MKNLRNKYPKFIYKNYFYKILNKDLKISFCFEIVLRQAQDNPEQSRRVEPGIFFEPKVIIKNVSKEQIVRAGERVLDNLVFHLGLIELLSYWKTTCSPKIEIQTGFLNKEQIGWWKELISNGMGQFFYENKINFLNPNFLKISTIYESGFRNLYESGFPGNKISVPIGGGKDSALTLELLKRSNKNIRCFSLNPTNAALKIIKIAGCKNPVVVKRKIDKKLLELNQKGFLNGHTPFSAYLAFLSVLLAAIFDFKFIAFSNEKSSNEGNVRYLGRMINHQYSKSFDFEKKFRDYSKKYLAKDVYYFSFLRPLYEIQIAKLFSKYPRYFKAFLSCNPAYRTNSGRIKPIKKWCGKCPKCLFTFAALYPFLEETKILKIFGKNLFADKTLLPLMEQLAGERGFKPFECVGAQKESLAAFYLALRSFKGAKLPFLLDYFQKKILPKYPNLKKDSHQILRSFAKQNYLPKSFERILKFYVGTLEK
jgi:hypothetical protein